MIQHFLIRKLSLAAWLLLPVLGAYFIALSPHAYAAPDDVRPADDNLLRNIIDQLEGSPGRGQGSASQDNASDDTSALPSVYAANDQPTPQITEQSKQSKSTTVVPAVPSAAVAIESVRSSNLLRTNQVSANTYTYRQFSEQQTRSLKRAGFAAIGIGGLLLFIGIIRPVRPNLFRWKTKAAPRMQLRGIPE